MLDLRMSGMDGQTAYRSIKAFDPDARVLVASGIDPDKAFVDELKQGGCAFIEKPFGMDTLAQALYRIAKR